MTRLSVEDAAAMIGQIQGTIGGPLSLSEASQKAAANMTDEYRELISTLPDDWPKKVFAWLRIHGPSGDEAITTGNVFLLESWMKAALLGVIDAGLTPVVSTPEAESEFAKLRREVAYCALLPAQAVEEAPPEPQPAHPTEADLDARIENDWRTLPTSEIRSKCRDTNYRERFDRLMAAGRLGR